MFEKEDNLPRHWRRSIKKIGILVVLAGLAPALSADSHSPAALPDNPAAVSTESALSALSDGFLYSDYLQNLPNLQTETTPVVSGFHGSFAVENRPSLLESIADNLPDRLHQEAQSAPLREWGLGWAIDSRRPEVVPALAEGGWRLADWLGDEVLLAATDGGRRRGWIRNLEFDLQSKLGGRRAAVGVNALGAFRETDKDAIAWQVRGFRGEDGIGGNVGAIYRWSALGDKHLFGANVFFDYEDHDAGAFNRWSAGSEWRSQWVDAFLNVYRGLTDSKRHKGDVYYTADGHELEINVHSPDFERLAGALTYYKWKGEKGDSDDSGFRFGLKFTPTVAVVLELEYDNSDKDNDWGGRVLYSGEFGGLQSPSVRGQSGQFNPSDFFFAAVNRENTQRIRKVEARDNTVQGRYISFQNRSTNPDPITVRGADITLILTYAAPNYIATGVTAGASLSEPQTITASRLLVPSSAETVTIASADDFVIEHARGAITNTLFVGSTLALAEDYAHLIHGKMGILSGGGGYNIGRNIIGTLGVMGTYDRFVFSRAAAITLISPVPVTAAVTLADPEGVRVQRFSTNTLVAPSTAQIVLADQLFNPQINGAPIAPTGGDGNYTLGIFGAPDQNVVITVSPAVLEGFRITLVGDPAEFDSGEDLTLTITIPSSGNAKGESPHILRIERDPEAGLPVPEHVNTVRFAYQRIDNLEINLHDPESGTGAPVRFVTLGAAAVASVSVGGGDPTTRDRRIVSGGGVFSLDADGILRINAPAHGTYTVSVEVFDAFPDSSLSPPLTAGLEVLFTTILAPVRGGWRFGGRDLGTHATVTVQRTPNPPALTVAAVVPRGGNNTYKAHVLQGADAGMMEFDGNNLVVKDSTNPAAAPGNEIDIEVVIDDTSDPNLPIARLAVPATLTLKLFYVEVGDLSHSFVESGGDLRGTVLAAAATPSGVSPTVVSVAISGGDGNAELRRTGGNAAFAVGADNHIVWTPRAFGEESAMFELRDGLTGLPGGTTVKTFALTANLIRAASLAFDGGHLTPDNGIASLTVTAFFGEEIPLAMRSFATLNFAAGYGEIGFTDIQGDRFFEPANSNGVFVINQTTRAEATPKTATMFIRYRRIDNSTQVLEPIGHRYAVRLESAYRPLALSAVGADGSGNALANVRTHNAAVASLTASGGGEGRSIRLLANPRFAFADGILRLNVGAGDEGTHSATLEATDSRGTTPARITLEVEYKAIVQVELDLVGPGGTGSASTLVLENNAVFARVMATGGDSAHTFTRLPSASGSITVAANGDLHFNVAANDFGAQTITVRVTGGAGTEPATLIVTANYINFPYMATDYRGNSITPNTSSDPHVIAVDVNGPDSATWGSTAPVLNFLTLTLRTGATAQSGDFDFSGNTFKTNSNTALSVAPGTEQTGRATILVNGAAFATVLIRARFIRTQSEALALALEKPNPAASGPVRWFTALESDAGYTGIASLKVSGGGMQAKVEIEGAPGVFQIDADNILGFRPLAKKIYTVTVAASDLIGSPAAKHTVTVAYGDPLAVQMNSGGHGDSVQNGTLSNGGTVNFHNFTANDVRMPLNNEDWPIATLAASGGVGDHTFTEREEIDHILLSNEILYLRRYNGQNPALGNGQSFDHAQSHFAYTLTVDDGFDASPPMVISITGRAVNHNAPADNALTLQLEDGGNVFARHTRTDATPELTLGLPSTLAIDTADGFAVATLRLGGGYASSRQIARVAGSSSGDMVVSETATDDGASKLRQVILQNSGSNLADFPADAAGESNARSIVIRVKTDGIGPDFFDGREPTAATVSLMFKIKKMTATRESKDLIAAANAAIPATLVSGSPIRETADNSGDIDIARTDNTLTYAGLTIAKITFANLVRLGGKRVISDLIDVAGINGNATSIITLKTGSAEGEIFVHTRAPAEHVENNPFIPAYDFAANKSDPVEGGGFTLNVSRHDIPAPLRVEAYRTGNNDNTRGAKIVGEPEFLIDSAATQRTGIGWAVAAGGTGNDLKMTVAPHDDVDAADRATPAASFLLKAQRTAANASLTVSFHVNDAPDASWPSGVDFTPERVVQVAFTGQADNAALACGSGGQAGMTDLYTEPTGVVGGGIERTELAQGLTWQGTNIGYRTAQNLYLSNKSDRRRYHRCAVSSPSREDIICTAGSNVIPIRGGDVVLVSPSFKSDFNQINGRAHFFVTAQDKFSSAGRLVEKRDQSAADEQNINLFRVYHKPGVFKTATGTATMPNALELFLAKGVQTGQAGDYNRGCHSQDLPEDGNQFYLTDQFVRTYKWREAAPVSAFSDEVISSSTRPPAFENSDLSCLMGGDQGRTQRFFDPGDDESIGAPVLHPLPTSVRPSSFFKLTMGLVRAAWMAYTKAENVYLSYAATEAHGSQRYGQCARSANNLHCGDLHNRHAVPGLTYISHLRGGDVVLVAAGYFPIPGNIANPHNLRVNGINSRSLPHAGGTGRQDSAVNFLRSARAAQGSRFPQHYNMERHSNIFRLYYRDGAESNPYEPTESDVFLARGEESGGVTDDYDAGCFTEDLPEDGTKFYLDKNFYRTYKWREAVSQSILDDRRIIKSNSRPGPGPVARPDL